MQQLFFIARIRLQASRNLTIRDTQNPRRVYTIEKLIDDSELNQPWIFRDPITNSPLSGIEIIVDGVSYGTSDQNGEINKPLEIEEIVDAQKIPKSYYLNQNYPNPFNPGTVIEYGLPKASRIKLEIYNILGQKVMTLLDKEQSPGTYKMAWDGKYDLLSHPKGWSFQ